MPSEDRTPAQEVDLTEDDVTPSTTNNNNLTATSIAASTNLQLENFVNVDLNENQTAFKSYICLPKETNELPTYEEVIYQKQNEANGQNSINPPHFLALPPVISLTTDQNELPTTVHPDANGEINSDIGTDCIFIASFMVSFFFNWIGFFTCICLMPTMAGKYGALSGFGLSMVKWATIVRVCLLFYFFLNPKY